MMFAPFAQGTIRPLSERLPFLISLRLFDLDNLPFRVAVFITAAIDILLIVYVTRRITSSRLAGSAAAFFWATGAGIISPMTWNSSYNEVQCPVFLLGGIALFAAWIDSGKKRYWWWQLVLFIAGLGSLETMVVYPVLCACWALFVVKADVRRNALRSTIPLFALAVAFSLIHTRIAPLPKDGVYALRFDRRLAATFWEYWRWSFLPEEWAAFRYPAGLGIFVLVTSMAGFALFVVGQIPKRRISVFFGLAWFLLTLAPMLPLPDRHSEYYLAIPVIGLAMLAGAGVSQAWEAGWRWRAAAIVPVAAWFGGMVPSVRAATAHWVDESAISRTLVLGARAARAAHPGKAILLDGITDQQYRVAVADAGFLTAGVDEVYLTPRTDGQIHPAPDDDEFEPALLDPAVAQHAVQADGAIVYSPSGDHLRNITATYARYVLPAFPRVLPGRVELGGGLYSYLLGPHWQLPQGHVRWMPDAASLSIGTPDSPGEKLILTGYSLDRQFRSGPQHISLSMGGIAIGATDIALTEPRFVRAFPLPPGLIGRGVVTLSIVVQPVAPINGSTYGIMVESVAVSR